MNIKSPRNERKREGNKKRKREIERERERGGGAKDREIRRKNHVIVLAESSF